MTFESGSSGEEGENGDRGEINMVGYPNRENKIAAHPEKRTQGQLDMHEEERFPHNNVETGTKIDGDLSVFQGTRAGERLTHVFPSSNISIIMIFTRP